jgi:hypothetical protein
VSQRTAARAAVPASLVLLHGLAPRPYQLFRRVQELGGDCERVELHNEKRNEMGNHLAVLDCLDIGYVYRSGTR